MDQFIAQGHKYGFEPQFLRYRDPVGREALFPYKNGLRLRISSWTGELKIRFGDAFASLDPLPIEQRREFILELFRRWNQAHWPDLQARSRWRYDRCRRAVR